LNQNDDGQNPLVSPRYQGGRLPDTCKNLHVSILLDGCGDMS
jgi:hypothetical protein